jgi:hypothetical protein
MEERPILQQALPLEDGGMQGEQPLAGTNEHYHVRCNRGSNQSRKGEQVDTIVAAEAQTTEEIARG